jgi:glycosyltransferase involved in cell wall biosynthesis
MVDLAVIMSIYHNDRLDFVKESVQSILDQTFKQFHYYLIFDGPVYEDVDKYISALKDERIRLFRLEKNRGLAGALNYLLEIVLKNTEYKMIARMDADDISLPTRFEKQRNFLLKNQEISIIGCWYEEIDEEGEHLSYRKLPTDHESLRKRYFTGTPFAHPSVIYSRELIEKVGFYPTDTVLMEDNVLWGRALNCCLKFANIPEFLLKFRIDRNFYKRRSGIEYGWNFLKTRLATNRLLDSPLSSNLFLIGLGLLKMSPTIINKAFYQLHRYYMTNP